jgi:chlorite dismutase
VGEALAGVERLHLAQEAADQGASTFVLAGVTSHDRYLCRDEKTQLILAQEALGRPEAIHGALIPIRKNEAWWALTQDERRAIFEESSHHIQIGNRALPQVARRLHHCRDLPGEQPFDFLTWFDFHPDDEGLFDDLLGELRATEEWKFIDREVEVRVRRGL